MQTTQLDPRPSPLTPKLALSLVGISLLWFFDLTDYSLPGMLADALVPLIGIIAGFLLLSAKRTLPQRSFRIVATILAIAALLESFFLLAIFALLFALSPMGMAMIIATFTGETPVQSIPSPDGTRIAECYENNISPLRIKYTFFPIVERDITSVFGSSACGFRWQDNDTLYSEYTGGPISVGIIKADQPPTVTYGKLAWAFAELFEQINRDSAERLQQDEIKSAPLKTIPVYPGGTTQDYSGADMLTSGGYRAFDIQAPNSDEAAAWYQQVLSEGDWSVISTSRSEFYAETTSSKGKDHIIDNCIDSTRRESDGITNHYYWKISWYEQSNHVRIIVQTPESSVSVECD